MINLYMSRLEAKNKYEELRANNFNNSSSLPKDLNDLRIKLLAEYQKSKKDNKQLYDLDISFGIELWSLLKETPSFTKSLASNYDFWRYFSLCVIPEIIFDRYGDNPSHFYEKNVRIYPSTLFWYIELFNKGNKKSTLEFLSLPCFSTDTILQTIERTGNETNVNVFREILDQYSSLNFNKIGKDSHLKANIYLRKILVQHMARSLVIVPEFYEGGIKGYVAMLINSI